MKRHIRRFFRQLFCAHAWKPESDMPICRVFSSPKTGAFEFRPYAWGLYCPHCHATKKVPFIPAQ